MSVALRIYDQTNAQEREPAITLTLASETISVRELIERRVREEVEVFNSQKPELFRGLVQPTDTERTLNGYRFRKPKTLDWREQADAAVDAFENGRIYLLVDDRQFDQLDEQVAVTDRTEVVFLKLVPLIGG
jgi:hypothetical protein